MGTRFNWNDKRAKDELVRSCVWSVSKDAHWIPESRKDHERGKIKKYDTLKKNLQTLKGLITVESWLEIVRNGGVCSDGPK